MLIRIMFSAVWLKDSSPRDVKEYVNHNLTSYKVPPFPLKYHTSLQNRFTTKKFLFYKENSLLRESTTMSINMKCRSNYENPDSIDSSLFIQLHLVKEPINI